MKKFNKNKFLTEDKKNIQLDKFADFLIEEHGICLIDGKPGTYRPQDGVYSCEDDEIEQVVWNYFPGITSHKRTEVVKAVRLMLNMKGKIEETDDYKHLIAFRNGVYNLDTKELLPFSKDYIILNKIDWNYNPNAKSKYVDSMLDKISCFDPEIRAIMEELVGYAMYRGLEYDTAFILVGSKARNGKSTFTGILEHLLGKKNCSSADLRKVCDIKDEYTQAKLYGKLANIGDDISGEYIPDPSTFKSITSGETVQARQIYGKPFEFNPYATMIFSANNIPKIKDADNGVKRRMKIIPFDYQFDPTAADFDRNFENKIKKGAPDCSADDSMSYLINLGLAGLDRVFNNGDFTVSQKVEAALDEYNKECNPILAWIEEYLFENTTFCDKRRDLVYDDYKMWCERSGQKAMSQTSFVRFINDKYNLKVEPQYQPDCGKSIRTFVNKDE